MKNLAERRKKLFRQVELIPAVRIAPESLGHSLLQQQPTSSSNCAANKISVRGELRARKKFPLKAFFFIIFMPMKSLTKSPRAST